MKYSNLHFISIKGRSKKQTKISSPTGSHLKNQTDNYLTTRANMPINNE